MATGLESLVQTQPSPAVEEKEEEGFIDKTMDVAGDVWKNMSALDKAALLTSPVPIVGDLVGGAADAKALFDDPSLLNLASDDVRLPLVKITEETKKSVRSALSYANLI